MSDESLQDQLVTLSECMKSSTIAVRREASFIASRVCTALLSSAADDASSSSYQRSAADADQHADNMMDDSHPLLTTPIIPSLIRTLSYADESSAHAARALINMSSNDICTNHALRHGAAVAAVEAVRDPAASADMRGLLLMLIANLTRTESGACSIVQEGSPIEGLHVRRILSLAVTPTAAVAAAVTQQADPYAHAMSILTNVTQIAGGRRVLLQADRGFIESLSPQLTSASHTRRLAAFQLFKNLFMSVLGIECACDTRVYDSSF